MADAVPDQPRRAQMMLDRHEWLVGRRAEVTEEVGGSPGAGRRPRTRHQALQEEAEALVLGIRLSVFVLSIVRVVWSASASSSWSTASSASERREGQQPARDAGT